MAISCITWDIESPTQEKRPMQDEIIDYLVDEEFDSFDLADIVNPESEEIESWN